MESIFLAFLFSWASASAARLRSESLPFPKDGKKAGAPAGASLPVAEDDDDDARSRALEAAIMGLSDQIAVPNQPKGTAGMQEELVKKPAKLRKQQAQPQRQQAQQVQPAKASLDVKKKGAKGSKRGVQYPPSGAVYEYPYPGEVAASPGIPVTTPAPTYAPYVATPAPYAAQAAVATTVGPSVAYQVAPQATAAPSAIDLGTWKTHMEQKLHTGLSSEIKILNTLLTHQTQTHKQLLRFKQVLTVLGQKYQDSELLAQQQQAKIASLEQQLAGYSQQVGTLNSKFEAYKKHYDQKWVGSDTAIQTLYKKTADALGAMSAVHTGVQQQLQAMTTPAPGTAAAPPPYAP